MQLAAPLLGALVASGASLGGVLLGAAACLAFLANEPLLVLLGHRGKRMKVESGPRARRRLWLLLPIAAAMGFAGLGIAPATLPSLAIVLAPAVILVALAWHKRERTIVGELVAAVSLSGVSLPIAVAAGATMQAAACAWITWAIGYAFTVVAVHRVIARHRRPATMIDVFAVTGSLAAAGGVIAIGLWAALPLAACAIGLLVLAPSAAHLRAIGFVLVGASALSVILLAA